MRYQLVLKFQGVVAEDRIVALLTALTKALAGSAYDRAAYLSNRRRKAEIDGFQGVNSGVNFFILTDDPTATFERAKPVLERRNQVGGLTAAYRAVDSKLFTVIWP